MKQVFLPGLLTIASVLAGVTKVMAQERPEFMLTDLPHGKSITLPHPAQTLVPITEQVSLSSTDSSQTLKISLPERSVADKPIRVAIHQAEGQSVQYIDVRFENPALYAFAPLSTIHLVPDDSAHAPHAERTHLLIESNRPLHISR